MKLLLLFLSFFSLFSFKATAQITVPAKDASRHIGETVRIVDKAFDGRKITHTNMVLLDIGGNRPDQLLTIIISNAGRNKFKGQPDVDYKGRDVIVTGKLVACNGKPAIIAGDPKQLKVIMVDNARTFMMPDEQKRNIE